MDAYGLRKNTGIIERNEKSQIFFLQSEKNILQ